MITFGNADDTEWRCQACGESLTEETDGYTDESGSLICDAYDPYEDPEIDDAESAPDFCEGPHRPQRVSLSWANGATTHTDPGEDSITVTISVGDPRGAFAFTVRRVPDDAMDNGGRLIMHTPYPGGPCRTSSSRPPTPELTGSADLPVVPAHRRRAPRFPKNEEEPRHEHSSRPDDIDEYTHERAR